MTISLLEKNNLLTDVYWEANSSVVSSSRAKAVKRLMARHCRVVSYIQESEDEDGKKHENHLYGYFDHQSLKFEPLALYIRMLFGDGFYYSKNEDGTVYLLIIKDNIIVPGTDTFISEALFKRFLDNKAIENYKDLTLFELTSEHVEAIISHYEANQQQQGQGQRSTKVIALVAAGLVLLLILLIFFVWDKL